MTNREWRLVAADLWVLVNTETGQVVARVEWPGFRLYRTGGQDYIDLESAKRAAEGNLSQPRTQAYRLGMDGSVTALRTPEIPDTYAWRAV